MKIDQVKYKIDEIGKQIELIKQSWIKKQNSNVKLLEQRNRQMSELKELRICKCLHNYKYIMYTNVQCIYTTYILYYNINNICCFVQILVKYLILLVLYYTFLSFLNKYIW